jgi:rubrerythrin
MAKKTPAQPAAPKTHPLDWWHKGIHPALTFLLAAFAVYLAFARQATEKEIERLKDEVKQVAEQEHQAKDETQWLRVEMAKEIQREKSSLCLANMPHVEGQNNVQASVAVAIWLAGLTGNLEAMKKNDAAKFGEEVKELWDKAVKQADEEKPFSFSDM